MREGCDPQDPWLDRWLPLLAQRAAGMPVLELGCGSGDDSEVLAAHGFSVTGLDLSEDALVEARARVPGGEFLQQDLRAPLPVSPGTVGVVLASLCLHYFPWNETEAAVSGIHAALRPGGVLLCRLNSTHDVNHGATGFPAIDENYYLVDGHPKRFFDQPSVRRLFGEGWERIAEEALITHKYERPKHVWEVVVGKVP